MHWLNVFNKSKIILRSNHGLSSLYTKQKYCQKSKVCVLKHLAAKIKFTGPITVQEFMKESLTHPSSGYYMKQTGIGSKGDFITSPEISQMFGEIIGVWILHEWQKLGATKPFQLIELGPGNGTMLADILRVFKHFQLKPTDVELHLVEKSQSSSLKQAEKLEVSSVVTDFMSKSESTLYYRSGKTSEGIQVFWYTHMNDIPNQFSMIIAHEFFDTLPIHRLKRTDKGWREILIDINPENEDTLRYVIAKDETPASKFYVDPKETRDEIEVCPEAGTIANDLVSRLERFGGAALIIDYGHNGELSDTFRAFRNHVQVDPLIDPGNADLTADVDYSFLKRLIQDRMATFGPITQQAFLHNMGIFQRLQILLKKSNTSKHAKDLVSGYEMLTEKDQMGERFKFFCFYPIVIKSFLEKRPPAGFVQAPIQSKEPSNTSNS